MNITRRRALGLMAGVVPALGLKGALAPDTLPSASPGVAAGDGPFQPSRASLAAYAVPEWFRDAKLGIWAHWGPQSAVEQGDWYARNMYLQGTPQYDHHVARYGHPSRSGFKDTIPAWKAERFDPGHLIGLYKAAGARYFMSMGVHHDNFDLWDSRHNRWNAVNQGPRLDIVGAWRKAARAQGLRFGVSEHLWITYKWYSVSHASDLTGPLAGVPYDGAGPAAKDLYVDSDQVWRDLDWNEDGIPNWWKRHWHERITDLVEQHEPDFLYSDGALPFQDYGYSVVSRLYNLSARRNGGSNQAVYFSKREADSAQGLCAFDKERGVPEAILPLPWQTDTCIGDWHYRRGAAYKSPKTVIDMLVDIVSKNGNLMLNIPLPASGTPDAAELAILDEITRWMSVNSEALHGTRPWKTFGDGPPVESRGDTAKPFNEGSRRELGAADVRYTTKGGVLFAFVMGQPRSRALLPSLGTGAGIPSRVELVGQGGPLEFTQGPAGLSVAVPETLPSRHAVALRILGLPA